MKEIINQIVSFTIGISFLVSAVAFSRKRKHPAIRYTWMGQDMNLIKKVELKGKGIYFDGQKQLF